MAGGSVLKCIRFKPQEAECDPRNICSLFPRCLCLLKIKTLSTAVFFPVDYLIPVLLTWLNKLKSFSLEINLLDE